MLSFTGINPDILEKLDIRCISPLSLLDLFPTLRCGIITLEMLSYIQDVFRINIQTQEVPKIGILDKLQDITHETNIIKLLHETNKDYKEFYSYGIYNFLIELIISPRSNPNFEYFYYIKNIALIHPKVDPLEVYICTLDKNLTKYIGNVSDRLFTMYKPLIFDFKIRHHGVYSDNYDGGMTDSIYNKYALNVFKHAALLIRTNIALKIGLLRTRLPKDLILLVIIFI